MSGQEELRDDADIDAEHPVGTEYTSHREGGAGSVELEDESSEATKTETPRMTEDAAPSGFPDASEPPEGQEQGPPEYQEEGLGAKLDSENDGAEDAYDVEGDQGEQSLLK